MALWQDVASLLAENTTPEDAPAPFMGDVSQLLPTRYQSALHARSARSIAQTNAQIRSNPPMYDPDPLLTVDNIEQMSAALKQLHTHFESLVDAEDDVSHALRGVPEGQVVWLAPERHEDFARFLQILAQQRERHGDSSLSQIVDWMLDSQFNQQLLEAGVEGAVSAFTALQDAFTAFAHAREQMVNIHAAEEQEPQPKDQFF